MGYLNKKKGYFGETLAAGYLISEKYKIVKRNWTCHWGELDIIAIDGDYVVFVEVKYRSSDKFGYGYKSINIKKKKTLHRTITNYLMKNNQLGSLWRCDILDISKSSDGINVKHYKGVHITE